MRKVFQNSIPYKMKGEGGTCGKSNDYCVDKAEFTVEIGACEQIYRVQMG